MWSAGSLRLSADARALPETFASWLTHAFLAIHDERRSTHVAGARAPIAFAGHALIAPGSPHRSRARCQRVRKTSRCNFPLLAPSRLPPAHRHGPCLRGKSLSGDRASFDASLALDQETVRAFKTFLRRKSYPCLGAKAALKRRALHCLCASDICAATDDERIVAWIQSFALKAHEEDVFVSLAVLFPASSALSETQFEDALWQRLGAMHVLDRAHHDWDASVSADPASRHFSMSVGGKGFFVIGLHPSASRLARRFRCPVMVFNLHSQFEQLRADGRYDKLRSAIAARDIAYAGSSNPMLATYGQRSEARQYSGRAVGDDWLCPFASPAEENPE